MEAKDIMNARISFRNVSPAVIQAMLGLEKQVSKSGLDSKLLDLVRMRASQINLRRGGTIWVPRRPRRTPLRRGRTICRACRPPTSRPRSSTRTAMKPSSTRSG
jgi:hypothetical protein